MQASGTLARIADDYPGRVAAIEMHVSTFDQYYSHEAFLRMNYYPPPYHSGGNWFFTSPWLWYDGDKHGGSDYAMWEQRIVNRMNQEAPVTITMGGHFSAPEDTGRVYGHFRNDSTDTITGRVIFVITEDSLYLPTPNGDLWHNHVPRDYLPDQDGQIIVLPPGDSMTIDQFFSLDTSWTDYMCEIVTWIQNDSMYVDSTREIWQGAMINVTDLTGIHERKTSEVVSTATTAYPNPCVHDVTLVIDAPSGDEYTLVLYDISGRLVKTFSISASGIPHHIDWNLRDESGHRVNPGVYFYCLEPCAGQTHGKLIVH